MTDLVDPGDLAPAKSTDHAAVVLAAMFSGSRDLVDHALRYLEPQHFPEREQRNLFQLTQNYYELTGAVITRRALGELMRRSDSVPYGTVVLYEELYDSYVELKVTEADFRWSVDELRDQAARTATLEALTRGVKVLQEGEQEPKGRKLYGHADARAYVLSAFSQLERELAGQQSPEGNVRHEAADLMAEYAEIKKRRLSGEWNGPQFGIAELDLVLGGLQRGEVTIVAGYTSSGKTSTCVQLVWHTAVRQAMNVVYFTSETLRRSVRHRLLARHSLEEMFEIPEGINTRDLKNGTLSEEREEQYRGVVADFTANPAYGHVYIAQVPHTATVATLESILARLSKRWRADLVVVDSLNLLRSDVRRTSDREMLGTILKDAQQASTLYADGLGVPVVSPWQVNRKARDEALRLGYYTLQSLAETAEASQTPGVVMSVLEPEDSPGRHAEVKMQLLKNRDGERLSSLVVDVDYAVCRWASRSVGSGLEDMLESTL